jgi:hypothetical protein
MIGKNYRNNSGSSVIDLEASPDLAYVEPGYWDPEVEEMLEQAEQDTGIEMKDNFSGAQKAELPEGAVAGTAPLSSSSYSGIEVENQLFMDEDLLSLPDESRNQAMVHEYVHSLDHQEDSETLAGLMDYAGFSDEAQEIVYDYLKFGSKAEKEAATEFVALNLNPDGEEVAGTFYPLLTSKISEDLFQMGEHPDYGIAEELEREKREVAGDLYSIELENVVEEDWEDPYSNLYEEVVDRVNSYTEDMDVEDGASVLTGYGEEYDSGSMYEEIIKDSYGETGAYSVDLSAAMDGEPLEDPIEAAGADTYTNEFGA